MTTTRPKYRKGAPVPRRAPKIDLIAHLPFVDWRPSTPRDYWHGLPSAGSWSRDCDVGGQCAWLALQAMKADQFPPLLGLIILDMIKNRAVDGMVVGFGQTLADVALGVHAIPDAKVLLAVPHVLRGRR